MPLRSVPSSDAYPDNVACPTSCQLRGASAPQPASELICHPETLPRLVFFVALICPPVPHGSYYDIRLAGGMARGEAVAAVAVGKFYRRGSQ